MLAAARAAAVTSRTVAPRDNAASMEALRRARDLIRLMLVVFVLAIGVAIASPVFNPKALDLVCSGIGVVKLVDAGGSGETGSESPRGHTLDCPLCASLSAPPPVVRALAAAPQVQAHARRLDVAMHVAVITGSPLPPRGPPALH